MRKKQGLYILLLLALVMCSCQDEGSPEPERQTNGDFYIRVDLPETPQSTRVTYEYDSLFYEWEPSCITARWEIGDVIKVYESKEDDNTFTDVFADYDAYNTQYPFPYAPVDDKYYRFECVGYADAEAGQQRGTAHGIFKYVGLAKTHVWAGVDGIFSVDIDVIYNHKINNWNRFEGLVIYGNPMRNYMMRHQEADANMTHLKYGQRMKGHICAKNFADWFSDTDLESEYGENGGAEGLILYNTSNCVLKVVMSRFENDIYGGASLEVRLPGITSGHPKRPDNTIDYRNYPMTLTLGNADDYYERQNPWAQKYVNGLDPKQARYSITGYVMGWPGTMPADSVGTVVLHDPVYGKKYTWELTTDKDIVLEEGYYYTIDLTKRIPTVEGETPVTPPFEEGNEPVDPI